MSTGTSVLRGGIMGFGSIGPVHLASVMGSSDDGVKPLDGARIVAVADLDAERRAQVPNGMARYGHFDALINDPDVDVVHICLPHHLHAPACIAAAERGKHVICEKPMALDATEARRMHDACRANGVTFGLISQNRFNPEKRWIKDRITSGQLDGLVRSDFVVDWFRGNDYYAEHDGWRGREACARGGALTNQAYHTLDLVLWLVQRPVVAVCATAKTRKDIHPDIEVADTLSGWLRFDQGAEAKFFVTTCGDPSDSIRIALATDGANPHRVVVDGNRILEQTLEPDAPVFPEDGFAGLGKACYGMSHQRNIAVIYEAIRRGTTPSIHAEDGIRTLEVIDAILASNGREISLVSGEW